MESEAGQEKMKAAAVNYFWGSDTGIEAFVDQTLSAAVNLCGMIVYSVIIARNSAALLLMLLILTGIVAFVYYRAGMKASLIRQEGNQNWQSFHYLRGESIAVANGKDIRLFRMKEWFSKAFEQLAERAAKITGREWSCYLASGTAEKAVALIRDGMIYGYLIAQMMQGKIGVSLFLLYIGIVAGFGGWMTALVSAIQNILKNSGIVSRTRDFERAGMPGKQETEAVKKPGVMHELRLEKVCFRYPGSDEDTLHDLSMTIQTNMNKDLDAQGVTLSGGELQKLMLARALYKNAPVVILDEPTAALLMVAALFAANVVFSARTSARYAAAQKEIFEGHTGVENKIAYLLHQVVGNHKAAKIIRIFDMKGMIMENVRKEWNKSRKFFEKMENTDMRESMTYAASNSVFTVLSYLIVAAKVVTRAVSIGSFTQYVGALNQFGSAYTGLITENAALRRCCSYMKEFLDFMEMEGCHAKGTIPVEKRLDGEYELAFEDVSFHYPGNEEMVLKHVTCRLNMINKMAVVGRNGAGKTTFIKLLCRLYEPTEGRITLNGVDIRKYREEEYRDLFGVVFQDFRLFAFPVWENIAAGYEREDERIWEALRQAGAEGFVKEMPDQLETCLYKNMEEGVEISGGEAQKLAIARALYKDAALVILDEPTAALDPVAEAEVYARFDEMVKNKTSVYISHRMSSCRFCDDIIVFDEGRIVERGSHERLLEADGQYAKMWHAQAKYYA